VHGVHRHAQAHKAVRVGGGHLRRGRRGSGARSTHTPSSSLQDSIPVRPAAWIDQRPAQRCPSRSIPPNTQRCCPPPGGAPAAVPV
jgi:hypothetical protein